MSKRQIERLLMLNVPIIIINILIFSEGFFGLSMNGTTLEQSVIITDLIVSIGLAIYGNYRIFFHNVSKTQIDTKTLKKSGDWINLLESYTNNEKASKFVFQAIDQIRDLDQRIKILNSTLTQYFSAGEMTFNEFSSAIDNARDMVYKNIEKTVNRINFLNSGVNSKAENEKLQSMQSEILDYIKGLIDTNSEILLELYNLNYELCKLDSRDEIENSDVLSNLRKVTQNVELYN